MYCPICGSEMEEVEHGHEGSVYKKFTEARLLYCTGDRGCFGKTYPLIMHGIWGNKQKVGDFDTYPGDSFSLTWIK